MILSRPSVPIRYLNVRLEPYSVRRRSKTRIVRLSPICGTNDLQNALASSNFLWARTSRRFRMLTRPTTQNRSGRNFLPRKDLVAMKVYVAIAIFTIMAAPISAQYFDDQKAIIHAAAAEKRAQALRPQAEIQPSSSSSKCCTVRCSPRPKCVWFDSASVAIGILSSNQMCLNWSASLRCAHNRFVVDRCTRWTRRAWMACSTALAAR